ncbi:MAG: hypothetical protein EGR02_05090 [Clostridiales bacterium]|nr:hypothetical protein [Clostridiales bacterium]MDY3925450.1 hypothetical protein [Eubacteriales bacterium]
MSENRFPCGAAPSANGCGREGPRETACIETNRILDSCRDRDCYENARVYLTDMGQELIENTGQVRVKECCIAWTYIGIDPVQFNRGFYAITIRFFVKLICEACVRGGRGQEFDGIAVLEKQVVLFGGDSNVSVFRSSGDSTAFCAEPEPCYKERTVPTAVVEVVDPIVLGCRVMEPCDCACIPEGRPGDIPESIAACLSAPLACDAPPACGCGGNQAPRQRRVLTVSLGVFSLIRVVRPAQYLITASEFVIPDKECVSATPNDPCSLFRSMAFPISEFSPSGMPAPSPGGDKPGRCGCGS